MKIYTSAQRHNGRGRGPGSQHGCHHECRGLQLPFVSVTPCGSSTPACHCTSLGAAGCRCCKARGSRPRMLTSGLAGASVNFSQQSPLLCECASGSKQVSNAQKANALQGRLPNGPAFREAAGGGGDAAVFGLSCRWRKEVVGRGAHCWRALRRQAASEVRQ